MQTELRIPIFFAGWTATCFLELSFLRDLWSVGRPGTDFRAPLAIRLAYPVCFTPFPAWLFAAWHLPGMFFATRSEELPDLWIFAALVPVWIYSMSAILISFFCSDGGFGRSAFLRVRILALYNLTVPLLLLVT